jgi:pimeloyl-ACP methyl ester carboxylesterase
VVLSGTGKGQSPPIDLVQPDYLQVATSGTGGISRAYPGADGGTTDRVIQFDYRFDGTSGDDSDDDSIEIFGDNAGKFGLDQSDASVKTNTWAIKASLNQRGAVWEFGYLDHRGKISFIVDVKSGVVVKRGDVYQFTIDESLDGASETYIATVRDTTAGTVYQTPVLRFCAKELGTDHLDFGMSLSGGETGKFSVDAIHVATKATPAPVVFVIGGLGATQNPERGVLSVQEDYGPLFQFDGINAKHFRWFEENYDTDTSVNPDGDSIAAEIDKVPLGTPVVLMGLSFGGAQAIVSAAEVDRPINDLILFDPVVKGAYWQQVSYANGKPSQTVETVPGNVEYAADLSRVIFQPDGSLYPKGPYAFRIVGRRGDYENLPFPRSTKHQAGQVTPRALTPGVGGSGDPINDTSELVENAVDGLALFWDGVESV